MKITGKRGGSDEAIELSIAGGRVSEIVSSPRNNDGDGARIAPGLIDIQINGYDGVDFNDADSHPDDLASVASKLWKTGVTSFCPTVITGSFEHIANCIENVVKAADNSRKFRRAMIGIHLEGPFISPEDGPRGAHPREHARAPDWDQFQRWQEKARGGIRIVTLSPEWPGAIGFIARAVEAGVIVAIGHTAATPAQIVDAVRAGASLSTHLGNGSHAKIDRHPNYIWEQLAADQLWASFIVDGHHLPPAVVKCFLRSKKIERSILVTDAIAAAGKPPGKYRLGNVDVEVNAERRVCLPGTPYLAGSVLEMHEAIGKTVQYSDASLDDALLMASGNPARLLGVAGELGSLEPGRRADLIIFERDQANPALDVTMTIVNGEIVYEKLRG